MKLFSLGNHEVHSHNTPNWMRDLGQKWREFRHEPGPGVVDPHRPIAWTFLCFVKIGPRQEGIASTDHSSRQSVVTEEVLDGTITPPLLTINWDILCMLVEKLRGADHLNFVNSTKVFRDQFEKTPAYRSALLTRRAECIKGEGDTLLEKIYSLAYLKYGAPGALNEEGAPGHPAAILALPDRYQVDPMVALVSKLDWVNPAWGIHARGAPAQVVWAIQKMAPEYQHIPLQQFFDLELFFEMQTAHRPMIDAIHRLPDPHRRDSMLLALTTPICRHSIRCFSLIWYHANDNFEQILKLDTSIDNRIAVWPRQMDRATTENIHRIYEGEPPLEPIPSVTLFLQQASQRPPIFHAIALQYLLALRTKVSKQYASQITDQVTNQAHQLSGIYQDAVNSCILNEELAAARVRDEEQRRLLGY